MRSFGLELVNGCIRCSATSVATCAASWCCDEAKTSVTSMLNLKVLYADKKSNDPSAMPCDMKTGAANCNDANTLLMQTTSDSFVSVTTDGGFWPEIVSFAEMTECPKNFRRLTEQQCHPKFFKHPPNENLFQHDKSFANRPSGCTGFFRDDKMLSLFWNTNTEGSASQLYRLLCIPGYMLFASLSTIPN